jgi:hypothetical protein
LLAAAAAALSMAGPLAARQGDPFAGRPIIEPGSDRGYFVWRDADRWHVRWTTAGGEHRFSGSVKAGTGKLKSLDRIDVEQEFRVLRPGRTGVRVGPRGRVHRVGRGPVVAQKTEDKIEKTGEGLIVWASRNQAEIDGFDFTVNEAVTTLELHFEIDGRALERIVRVGAEGELRSNPLRVVVR